MRSVPYTATLTTSRRLSTHLDPPVRQPVPVGPARQRVALPDVVSTSLVTITPDRVGEVAARLRGRAG